MTTFDLKEKAEEAGNCSNNSTYLHNPSDAPQLQVDNGSLRTSYCKRLLTKHPLDHAHALVNSNDRLAVAVRIDHQFLGASAESVDCRT